MKIKIVIFIVFFFLVVLKNQVVSDQNVAFANDEVKFQGGNEIEFEGNDVSLQQELNFIPSLGFTITNLIIFFILFVSVTSILKKFIDKQTRDNPEIEIFKLEDGDKDCEVGKEKAIKKVNSPKKGRKPKHKRKKKKNHTVKNCEKEKTDNLQQDILNGSVQSKNFTESKKQPNKSIAKQNEKLIAHKNPEKCEFAEEEGTKKRVVIPDNLADRIFESTRTRRLKRRKERLNKKRSFSLTKILTDKQKKQKKKKEENDDEKLAEEKRVYPKTSIDAQPKAVRDDELSKTKEQKSPKKSLKKEKKKKREKKKDLTTKGKKTISLKQEKPQNRTIVTKKKNEEEKKKEVVVVVKVVGLDAKELKINKNKDLRVEVVSNPKENINQKKNKKKEKKKAFSPSKKRIVNCPKKETKKEIGSVVTPKKKKDRKSPSPKKQTEKPRSSSFTKKQKSSPSKTNTVKNSHQRIINNQYFINYNNYGGYDNNQGRKDVQKGRKKMYSGRYNSSKRSAPSYMHQYQASKYGRNGYPKRKRKYSNGYNRKYTHNDGECGIGYTNYGYGTTNNHYQSKKHLNPYKSPSPRYYGNYYQHHKGFYATQEHVGENHANQVFIPKKKDFGSYGSKKILKPIHKINSNIEKDGFAETPKFIKREVDNSGEYFNKLSYFPKEQNLKKNEGKQDVEFAQIMSDIDVNTPIKPLEPIEIKDKNQYFDVGSFFGDTIDVPTSLLTSPKETDDPYEIIRKSKFGAIGQDNQQLFNKSKPQYSFF